MIVSIRIHWDALSYRPWENHLHLLTLKRGFVGQQKSSEKGTVPLWIWFSCSKVSRRACLLSYFSLCLLWCGSVLWLVSLMVAKWMPPFQASYPISRKRGRVSLFIRTALKILPYHISTNWVTSYPKIVTVGYYFTLTGLTLRQVLLLLLKIQGWSYPLPPMHPLAIGMHEGGREIWESQWRDEGGWGYRTTHGVCYPGLPDLVNKNTGCTVPPVFQINNKNYFGCASECSHIKKKIIHCLLGIQI